MATTQNEVLFESKTLTIKDLYNRYGAALLGYIQEIVNDHELAEQHLIMVFTNLREHIAKPGWSGDTSWSQLQRFTRSQLSAIQDHSYTGLNNQPMLGSTCQKYDNPYLLKLSQEQKTVFCSLYYEGKTVASLSEELRQTEDLTRKILKEAFAIMRDTSEY